MVVPKMLGTVAVSVKLHELVLPEPSVAVKVIVVDPGAVSKVPAVGVCVTVSMLELSVTLDCV